MLHRTRFISLCSVLINLEHFESHIVAHSCGLAGDIWLIVSISVYTVEASRGRWIRWAEQLDISKHQWDERKWLIKVHCFLFPLFVILAYSDIRGVDSMGATKALIFVRCSMTSTFISCLLRLSNKQHLGWALSPAFDTLGRAPQVYSLETLLGPKKLWKCPFCMIWHVLYLGLQSWNVVESFYYSATYSAIKVN